MCRAVLIAFMLALAGATRPAFEPSSTYDTRRIEGWEIHISSKLLAERKLCDDVLALLRVRLFEVNEALPARALEQLQDVAVWVELDDPGFPGMCFHPSRGWLRDNGYNPDKAGDIEVGNARSFLAWSHEQPAMVLHELAHAYHHKVLGAEHQGLRDAYEKALASGKYDNVLRASGKRERAYALNNPEEFFAELSESYFLTNDFYPFVRAELRDHDPEGFRLIRRLWNDPPSTRPAASRGAATRVAAP
jgi:hypothetical protein